MILLECNGSRRIVIVGIHGSGHSVLMTDKTNATGAPLKKIAFWLLLIVLVAVSIEGIAALLYRGVLGETMGDAAVELEALAPEVAEGREKAGLGFKDPAMSLHPFLGYVYTPKDSGDAPPPAGISISPDGFLDDKPAVQKRRDGALLIGILGGSVSGQLGSFHLAHFERALRRYPEFQDVELTFVRLGMPGYHQPQQVIQVAYILAQGGEFDVLLNLDGFNEVAVPGALNAPQGAHPLFPMNWSMVARDTPDQEVRRALGAIVWLKEKRAERAARFRTSPWAGTATGRLVWKLRDRELERDLARFAWELQEYPAGEIPYFVRGPARDHDPPGGLVPWCVAIWERSSVQLHAICEAHDIRYFHMLQPNQYLPGSKPLSRAESETAYDPESPYRAVIEEGYPLLRTAGEGLRASGISFHDLSMIFADTKETLYGDNCCHFNGEGNRILCDAIAAAFHEEW